MLKEAITDKTKWFIFASPTNPTGATYTREQIQNSPTFYLSIPMSTFFAMTCTSIVFDGRSFATLIEVEPRLRRGRSPVTASPKHSMTGWRVGFAAGPAAYRRVVEDAITSTAGSRCGWTSGGGRCPVGTTGLRQRTHQRPQDRRDMLYDALNAIPGYDVIVERDVLVLFLRCFHRQDDACWKAHQ